MGYRDNDASSFPRPGQSRDEDTQYGSGDPRAGRTGLDRQEPRTGYAAEFDDRRERCGQYGLIREIDRDAAPGASAQRPALGVCSPAGPWNTSMDVLDEEYRRRNRGAAEPAAREGPHARRDARPQNGRDREPGRYGGGFGGHALESGARTDGDQDPFDPDYVRWRQDQMRQLDDDYRTWRRERYQKFSEEFNAWRSSRTPAPDKPDHATIVGGSAASGRGSGASGAADRDAAAPAEANSTAGGVKGVGT